MIEAYNNHIKTLAAELGCDLKIDPTFRTSAMMYVEMEPPYVEVPPIENQIDYLINLHELMHVKHKDNQGRPPFSHKKEYFEKGVLRQEAFAWDEAIDLSVAPIENASRYFMWDTCLGSYYLGYVNARGNKSRIYNGNRHHVEFVYDEPGEYFNSVVKKIQGGLDGFKIEYAGKIVFQV